MGAAPAISNQSDAKRESEAQQRVFFHLAENKLDEKQPFAFLATCARSAGRAGKHSPLALALKESATDKSALAGLLEPVQKAARSLPWVNDLWRSGAIYRALSWRPAQAYRFLRDAEKLEQCGIGVLLPDWWKKRPRARLEARLDLRPGDNIGRDALLACDLRLALGDQELDDEEVERVLADTNGLVLIKNEWIEADSEKLKEALAHWREIKAAADRGGLNFAKGMRLLAGLDMSDSLELQDDSYADWASLKAGPGLAKLLEDARAEATDGNAIIPGLKGELRPYQKAGVNWLDFMSKLGLGACLADDMGLGKTIQALSLLLLGKDLQNAPALLVAPASLIANWKAEKERFAPELRHFILHPCALSQAEMEEDAAKEKMADADLVVTSYSMLRRLEWLQNMEWSRVILDEAQNIKNASARQSVAARGLKADSRIALTGTPVENSLTDLWTLFDFLNPGLMGTRESFGKLAKKLQNSPDGITPLGKLASPYILRRLKSDKSIIDSLPDKTEVKLNCFLSKKQARLYKAVVEKMQADLEAVAEKENNQAERSIIILRTLMRLKQVCNHPAQAGFYEEAGYDAASSGKFLRVGQLCSEIAQAGERALIFTQFREIIKPLGTYLKRIFGEPGLALHGNTPVKKRGELVARFQDESGPPFFILSLKAGGSGLNLTAAQHVIHFDRWWNPAVEDQATDRAYRIGQKKNVLVNKCVTLGTLEEKIDALIESKRSMAEELLGGMEKNITMMSDSEIIDLVRLDAGSLFTGL